jgi:hypothetical protein
MLTVEEFKKTFQIAEERMDGHRVDKVQVMRARPRRNNFKNQSSALFCFIFYRVSSDILPVIRKIAKKMRKNSQLLEKTLKKR